MGVLGKLDTCVLAHSWGLHATHFAELVIADFNRHHLFILNIDLLAYRSRLWLDAVHSLTTRCGGGRGRSGFGLCLWAFGKRAIGTLEFFPFSLPSLGFFYECFEGCTKHLWVACTKHGVLLSHHTTGPTPGSVHQLLQKWACIHIFRTETHGLRTCLLAAGWTRD